MYHSTHRPATNEKWKTASNINTVKSMCQYLKLKEYFRCLHSRLIDNFPKLPIPINKVMESPAYLLWSFDDRIDRPLIFIKLSSLPQIPTMTMTNFSTVLSRTTPISINGSCLPNFSINQMDLFLLILQAVIERS